MTRKPVEEELRLQREELDRVLASISDYLWSGVTDSEGRWTYRYYSPVVLKILGRPAEFFLAGPERWLSTVYPEDRPVLQQAFEGLRTGRMQHWEGEYRVVWPDGTVRWVRDSASMTLVAEGCRRVDGVVSDITEHIRAEAALRESEERWKAVFENNPVMYFMVDTTGTIISVNPFGAGQLGYSVDELIGRPEEILFHEADRERALKNKAFCLEHLG
jgi:PAS domain S-box-containing protein